MKTRKRALTAQIKPATRNAIMDQLALAADEIELQRDLAEIRAWFMKYQRETIARHEASLEVLHDSFLSVCRNYNELQARPLWRLASDRIAAWWRA